ncbi:MAG: hypothetical protein ABGX27_08760 [Desulfurobacteriaceae bacterium]
MNKKKRKSKDLSIKIFAIGMLLFFLFRLGSVLVPSFGLAIFLHFFSILTVSISLFSLSFYFLEKKVIFTFFGLLGLSALVITGGYIYMTVFSFFSKERKPFGKKFA